MKVHLIKEKTIRAYVAEHAASAPAFGDWLAKIRLASWKKPDHIKHTFASADLLGNGSNRVVFNVGGNNHRMICCYFFGETEVHLFICWLGTHASYNRLCENNKQYTVNEY